MIRLEHETPLETLKRRCYYNLHSISYRLLSDGMVGKQTIIFCRVECICNEVQPKLT